jgi:hypothetical protein
MRRRVTFRDRIARLSAALVAVVTRRRRPYRKNGEGLLARRAPAAPHPDPVVLVIVSLLAASSMPNDGVALTERTVPRQLCQTDPGYPGSALSSTTGSAIKRITAGVKACRWSYRQVRAGDRPSPSCTNQCRTKRKIVHTWTSASSVLLRIFGGSKPSGRARLRGLRPFNRRNDTAATPTALTQLFRRHGGNAEAQGCR